MSVPNILEQEAEPSQILIPKKKKFHWEKLAYELREMIFVEVSKLDPDLCIHESDYYFRRGLWMPPLVVALRDQPKSYSHVMEWYRQANSHLVYHVLDYSDLGGMTRTELEVIQSAELIFFGKHEQQAFFAGDEFWHLGLGSGNSKPKPWFKTYSCPCIGIHQTPPPSLRRALSLATNLKEVDLNLVSSDEHDRTHFLTEFPFCIEDCKALSKLTVHIRKEIWELDDQLCNKVVQGMISHLNQKTGVRAHLDYDTSRQRGYDNRGLYYTDEAECWTWEAYPGQIMDWSKKLGRIWKFPKNRQQIWESRMKYKTVRFSGDVLDENILDPRLEQREGRFTFGWGLENRGAFCDMDCGELIWRMRNVGIWGA